jgi:hypothetical protein
LGSGREYLALPIQLAWQSLLISLGYDIPIDLDQFSEDNPSPNVAVGQHIIAKISHYYPNYLTNSIKPYLQATDTNTN